MPSSISRINTEVVMEKTSQ